jgi:hypothetical protein
MSESAENPQADYLKSVNDRLETLECKDQFGKPITGLNPAELAAMFDFTSRIVGKGDAPIRCALELTPDVRKYVLLYASLLPLIKSEAERTGRQILFLAADGNREARARNEFRGMFAVTLGTSVTFGTWDQIEAIPENGFKQKDIRPFWIIGDVDLDRPLAAHYSTDAKNKAINRVLNDGACPVLLLHQKGETSILGFPPRFNDKPASKACFIATAACGSPYAPEVELLRGFRDEVLAPRVLGRAFVALYERCSPPLARWIAGHALLRKAVRGVVIRPLAWVVRSRPKPR